MWNDPVPKDGQTILKDFKDGLHHGHSCSIGTPFGVPIAVYGVSSLQRKTKTIFSAGVLPSPPLLLQLVHSFSRDAAGSRLPPPPLQLSRLLSEHVHVQRVTEGEGRLGRHSMPSPPRGSYAAAVGERRGARAGIRAGGREKD